MLMYFKKQGKPGSYNTTNSVFSHSSHPSKEGLFGRNACTRTKKTPTYRTQYEINTTFTESSN